MGSSLLELVADAFKPRINSVLPGGETPLICPSGRGSQSSVIMATGAGGDVRANVRDTEPEAAKDQQCGQKEDRNWHYPAESESKG